uniref:Transcription factor CBF/NF-Y/archaeal histone domain-containing protein n=1 Tax=Aegilops tauschii subsp. strangulata TaxID=200361 RepID=A0A453HYT0_AEGTS
MQTRVARIKKIMQADEDVGKIALAVPVLVSRALELFLQDLIDRSYKITLQSGAKTLNSFHLKQCVKRYSSFDFLTEIVNKVPDLGGGESCGDERGLPRRRKFSNGSDPENEEPRSSKMVQFHHMSAELNFLSR